MTKSNSKNKVPEYFYSQSGVIPYINENSIIKVLLIKSRSGKRWIIPKGIIEPKMSAPSSAAKEALEEAGITGKTFKKKICSYKYDKWGGICSVKVYIMKIEKVLAHWDEEFRERKFFTPKVAADKVDIKPLKDIIENIENKIYNLTKE